MVLRALKLGDLLVAVPALRGLRRLLPGHRIALATTDWLAPIVGLIEAVDEHLSQPGLDAPIQVRRPVDIAVNLHGDGPQSLGLVEDLHPRRLICHGVHGRPGPPWRPELHERERWVRLVNHAGGDAWADDVRLARPEPVMPGRAVLHVGAAYGAREWPVERFARVALALAERGERVVVAGGPGDVDRAKAVAAAAHLPDEAVLAGELSLGQSAALIAHARCLVSADNGAAHLASAFATPSVVIFGPAEPEIWGPPPGPHVVLTAAQLRRGDVFSSRPDPALMAVTAGDVVAAVTGLLEGADAARAGAVGT